MSHHHQHHHHHASEPLPFDQGNYRACMYVLFLVTACSSSIFSRVLGTAYSYLRNYGSDKDIIGCQHHTVRLLAQNFV